MRLAITVNSTQYQYSGRAARPANVAYFEKQVLIASPKPMTIPLVGGRIWHRNGRSGQSLPQAAVCLTLSARLRRNR
jgi:hypothetical protein